MLPRLLASFFALCLLLPGAAGCSEADASADGGGDAGTDDGGAGDAGPAPDAGDDAGDDGGLPPDSGMAGGSAGCGMAATIGAEEWVAHAMDVGGVTRDYFIYLPAGYDPSRAYPVVYQFHGCSDNPMRENNNVPVQRESGADAIHVRGRAIDDCWDTSPDGTGVALFDALVTEIEATYCADPERRFATGYSSGSFMTHRLACVRGDVLRGVASIAGGQGGGSCAGPVAALLIHDEDDPTVGISASEGARDAHLMRNGCDAMAATTPTEHPPCEEYAGCGAGLPVVWCQTSGMNHGRQDALAAPAFWDFLSGL